MRKFTDAVGEVLNKLGGSNVESNYHHVSFSLIGRSS